MTDQKTETMRVEKPKGKARFAKWGKYAGIAAFMFFFIKGCVWLVIAALAVWGIAG